MADFNKLFSRVSNSEVNRGVNQRAERRFNGTKQHLVKLTNSSYMRIRKDVFKHVGTTQKYWVNKAIRYAEKHKII